MYVKTHYHRESQKHGGTEWANTTHFSSSVTNAIDTPSSLKCASVIPMKLNVILNTEGASPNTGFSSPLSLIRSLYP